jgi:hypothetical protein
MTVNELKELERRNPEALERLMKENDVPVINSISDIGSLHHLYNAGQKYVSIGGNLYEFAGPTAYNNWQRYANLKDVITGKPLVFNYAKNPNDTGKLKNSEWYDASK